MTTTVFVNGVTLTDADWFNDTDEAVYDKLVGFYTPQMEGALADGSTDDTTAIQAAVDAISGAGGGTLYFPPGTYVSGQIALASNVSFLGAGWSSILKLKDSGNNFLLATTNAAVYVDNVAIKNLAIDGNKANNTTGGGVLLNGRNCEVSGCYIYDCPQGSIQAGAPSNGATDTPLAGGYRIINNYCLNNGKSGASYPSIAITHGSNIDISDNVVVSTDTFMTFGIDIEPNSGNTISSISIDGNEITGGRISVDGGNLSSPATNITVTDNFIDARGSDGPTQTNIAPLFLRKVSGFLGTGNFMIGHDDGVRGGIHVESALSNFRIADNLIIASQPAAGNGYGIHFNNAASVATNGEVSYNTLLSAETVSIGIFSFHATGFGSPGSVRIGPNTIFGYTTAISIQQQTDQPYAVPVLPEVSADNGDAAKTLNAISDEPTQVWATPLTVARAVTLNRQVDPGGLVGAKFRIVRTAASTGASALNVGSGPLKALATGQWCDVECRGDTWILTAFGSL